jgi:hypothetical protein
VGITQLYEKILDTVDKMEKPAVIQCNTAARASAVITIIS